MIRSDGNSPLLVNAASGHSVNSPQASNLNRQSLIQWNVAAGKLNQSWIFERLGTAYRIISRQNNLVIAAPEDPSADGPIFQLFSRGGQNELWQLVSVSR